jgi:hypothetical protein
MRKISPFNSNGHFTLLTKLKNLEIQVKKEHVMQHASHSDALSTTHLKQMTLGTAYKHV